MKEKILKHILKRLDRLEVEVFGNKKQKIKPFKGKVRNFKGPTGGLRLLISEGFFRNQKKMFTEIKNALNGKGYIYDRRYIQESLDRLSKKGGLLIKLKEKKKNYYAERK